MGIRRDSHDSERFKRAPNAWIISFNPPPGFRHRAWRATMRPVIPTAIQLGDETCSGRRLIGMGYKGYGTNVGQTLFDHRLTHCAFADDMTLIARNWTSMKHMLAIVRKSLAKFGLTLRP